MRDGRPWRVERALGAWAFAVVALGAVAVVTARPVPTEVVAGPGDAQQVEAPAPEPDVTVPSTTIPIAPPSTGSDTGEGAGGTPPGGGDPSAVDGSPDGLPITVTLGPGDLDLDLPPLAPPDDQPLTLPRGTVRVTVVDERGVPFAGACVDLWAFPAGHAADHPDQIRSGTSGDDGTYTGTFDLDQRPAEFPAMFPPLVSVTVRPCGFPATHFMSSALLEPERRQEIEVPVERTAALAGRLLVDGTPLTGQCVTAWTIIRDPDPGAPPMVTGPGVVAVEPVQVARATTGPDGSFRLGGFAAGRPASLMVSEGCTGPAGEPAFVATGGDYWPEGLVGAAVLGPSTPLGGPGSTTMTDIHVGAIGDERADAPVMSMPFYGIDTYLATRRADDPVPSCRPDAASGTTWRQTAYSGPVVGFGASTDRPVVLAAYADGPEGLVELGCVELAAGELRNGAWDLPPGALVMIQGIAGPTVGRFSHFAF